MTPEPPTPTTFTPDEPPLGQTHFPEVMIRASEPLEGNRKARRLAAKQQRAKRPVRER